MKINVIHQNEKFETIAKIDINDIQIRRQEDEDDDLTPINLEQSKYENLIQVKK